MLKFFTFSRWWSINCSKYNFWWFTLLDYCCTVSFLRWLLFENFVSKLLCVTCSYELCFLICVSFGKVTYIGVNEFRISRNVQGALSW